jgi:hypothetical protein
VTDDPKADMGLPCDARLAHVKDLSTQMVRAELAGCTQLSANLRHAVLREGARVWMEQGIEEGWIEP